MTMLADILLFAAAAGVAVYCAVLDRRLRRFGDTERGVGGAIATLSIRVDELKLALETVSRQSVGRAGEIRDLTFTADRAARRLEILIASLQGLEEDTAATGSAVLRLTESDRAGRADRPAGNRRLSRIVKRHAKATSSMAAQ